MIPGSTLLGYVNADHWGLAIPIEAVHAFVGERPDPTTFPLAPLFLAVVRFVAADIAADPGH